MIWQLEELGEEERETTCGRENGEGVGKQPIHTTARKSEPLQYIKYSMGWWLGSGDIYLCWKIIILQSIMCYNTLASSCTEYHMYCVVAITNGYYITCQIESSLILQSLNYPMLACYPVPIMPMY
jgi:hypothetical protein